MFKSLLAFAGRADDGSDYVFPTVNPKEDGPDCTKDCADCTVRYPSKFKVETSRQLYGHIKPFTTHLLVATGKDDWAEKVERERGSLMEALHDSSATDKYGRVMISASNIPVDGDDSNAEKGSTVLVLPSFTFVNSVTSSDIPELIDRFVAPNNKEGGDSAAEKPGRLASRPCPHDYVVLLCSHRRRDARCGISAPLIKKELERHLRPLGLYRDADDERPGGVGIYYVSHVGGHKFAANVLVYRKQDQQMIWLARIRPEHCEGIVKYTILKGKVVHPESQLRGGFDRTRGLTSW
ncbi:hypothetical protein DTO271D3_5001 [Paecilomyces variotii]|nr:hypothetical protein DTO271D3_5001 [Paecilomyces variotii]KAJ9404603.1 hypothetical protein DTO045G8_7676 [Paecilomyces variotii]